MDQPIDLTQDGGIMKEILHVGDGKGSPMAGDTVKVHYVGTLTDGTKFDSSRDRDEKFQFNLGKGEVIKSWDLGVASMTIGEIARFTCKSEYAYGKAGSPPKIPPDATLIFEIELFSFEGEDISKEKDKSIIKRLINSGTGYSRPTEGAVVTVNLIGRHDSKVFEERDVTFLLGEGSEVDVVSGIEMALEQFTQGEKSHIKLSPFRAFGSCGCKEKNIPPNAEVEYEVHLVSFEKCKESWEMSSSEKLEQSEICKTKGSSYFKADKFQLALKNYNRACTIIEHDNEMVDEEKLQRVQLLISIHLNQAICNLKLEDYLPVVHACDKVLEFDKDNVKALYRRGLARLHLHDFDEAIQDLQAVLKLDSNNKAAKNQILVAKRKANLEKEKQKKRFAGMFEKFAANDAKVEDSSVTDQIKDAPDKPVEDNMET